MQCDDISPALLEGAPGQMSSTEFRRTLYSWFEEKGLVADLRSYLRVQMINRLRNTAVGAVERPKPAFSLPKQAFSLVIAEHLLREGCHYTLSVFSTEVPSVASQLPPTLFETTKSVENEKWKFDEDSVTNLLELIGISKTSGESARVKNCYLKSSDSLLSCVISSKLKPNKHVTIDDNGDGGSLDDYLNRILPGLGVPAAITRSLESKIQQNLSDDRNAIVATHEEQIKKFGKLIVERDSQIRSLIEEQISTTKEMKRLRGEHKAAKKRTGELQLKEEAVKMREVVLRERLEEVEKLEKGFASLKKEKVECARQHCAESCRDNARLVEELRKEVGELREASKAKSVEFKKLHSQIALLTGDLRNSQAKIEFLNSCLAQSSQILSQPGDLGESSDETSESVTDEILKQVRVKLEELERESDALDSRFRQMKLK